MGVNVREHEGSLELHEACAKTRHVFSMARIGFRMRAVRYKCLKDIAIYEYPTNSAIEIKLVTILSPLILARSSKQATIVRSDIALTVSSQS